MVVCGGVLAVQAELALLGAGLRRGARWGPAPDDEHANLLQAVHRLRDVLRRTGDLRILDPNLYFGPFLAVVRSERTAAPVTVLALEAIDKFLSLGLMDPTHPSAPATVENIANAVTHARFVGTDYNSDGLVLMKILQILRTLMLSPEGAMLTSDSVCEIMLSCFRLSFETRLPELLRKNADQCLREMIQLVFMRLPQFAESINTDIDAGLGLEKGSSALSLGKRPTLSKQDKYFSKSGSDFNKLQDDTTKYPAEVSSPLIKTSSSDAHLNTTPCTISENTKDFVISPAEELDESNKRTASSNENSIQDSPSPTIIKSPSKKHGRHSSMDLASSDNIYISQLVEKCVIPSENLDPIMNCDENCEKVSNTNELNISEHDINDETPNATVSEERQDNIDEVIEEELLIQNYNENMSLISEDVKDYVNPRGVRFVHYDEQINLQPYGLACVRELLRFLISLCNPLEAQNTTSMVNLGLCLVETVLAVSADHLAKHPALLELIKDSLCRNLLNLLKSDRVMIIALVLQVSFLLFESLRTHLKFQMELFFIKLVEIIMSDNTKNTYEMKEITYLALGSIAQMWRIPGLCTELYLNYDCDIYCTNLFEDITKLLSKSIVASGQNNNHGLSLDALLPIIESIESNCHQAKPNMKDSVEDETKSVKSEIEYESENKKYISIDMEGCIETGEDSVVHDISQYITFGMISRHKTSANVPTPEQLGETKKNKRWIATGTELFNQKPEKGIEFLQEHGILAVPLDPSEIADFLKINPGLDKKMIGEYISKKKNVESRILATYAASFDMTGLRVDQALRLYLETFRLPGEAPLIFLVMEHFAEQWHNCNGHPFANTDAAFRLAYAIIMLNMDQHNHNAKKLNVPMTMEEFVRNLRGCNGSNDFDQKMLEAVFSSIKNEEIVMPAEHTGIVKENYSWKVLLRRGLTKEGIFMHCPSGVFDQELFTVTWGPMVAALSSIFEKSQDPELYMQALEGFDKCASIVSHFYLTTELDTLLLSLCKFTGLLNLSEQAQHIYIGVTLGQNIKAQLALKKVFSVCHRHANSIREGWKHILEVVLALFRGHLLPKSLIEADDFCSTSGKISLIHEPSLQIKTHEQGLLSSLYSYIALSSENNAMRNPNPEEAELIEVAMECVNHCNIDTMLLTDSKFLQLDSLQELVKYIIISGKLQDNQVSLKPTYTDDPIIFFLELLIKVVIQNRDRVTHVWQATESHVIELMKSSAEIAQLLLTEKMSNSTNGRISPNLTNRITSGLLERSSTGLLRLAINLMRNEECASIVLRSLKSFLDLSYPIYHHIATQIAIGLFELVKTSAQNIHSADDWALVFTLLETTGAGAMHLKQDEYSAGSKSDGAVSSEDDSVSTDRGYTSEGELSQTPPSQGWILIGKDSEGGQLTNIQQNMTSQLAVNPLVHPCALRPHDPYALLKCWECLAFIVRDVAHITPYNFESCVNCIRTFVEGSLHGTNQSKITSSHPFSNKDGKKKRQNSHLRRIQKEENRRIQSYETNDRDSPDGYQLISIQLLDLMHTLHSRTAQIFKWWREEANFNNLNSNESNSSATGVEWCNLWHLAWQPLLQGIARLCTDNRKQVSNSAVTYLQRALLVHDLQTLSGEEWEACFHCVLFPLLSRLTKHHDDIRLRANTIMCKVFLHHLTPLLGRPSFSNLWLSLLDLMRSLMTGSHTTDLLYEATLESLKNMLLVMDSVKVFSDGDNYSELWNITWDMINSFLPKLKEELFKPYENPKPQLPNISDQPVLDATTVDSNTVDQRANISATNEAPPQLNSVANFPPVSTVNTDALKVLVNPNSMPNKNTSPLLSAPNNVLCNSGPPSALGRTSSIILQPPGVGNQVHSPLFSHLGQMVSTPIGVAVPVTSSNAASFPILCPTPLPSKYYNPQVTPATTQNPQISSQLLNTSPSMIQNISPQSQFTLISPNYPEVSQNTIGPTTYASTSFSMQPSSSITKKSPSEFEKNILNDAQQPRSLFGEYITNPYNSLPSAPPSEMLYSNSSNLQTDIQRDTNTNLQYPAETTQVTLSQKSDLLLNCDSNSNCMSPEEASQVPLLQKSQSVTSSPHRSANQINSNFGSSDNIKNISNTDNANNSGMFSFSKYFYSEPASIPPGSEILFGNTLPQ